MSGYGRHRLAYSKMTNPISIHSNRQIRPQSKLRSRSCNTTCCTLAGTNEAMAIPTSGTDTDRPSRHLRSNRGKNPNARWLIDEPAKKKPTKRRKLTSGAEPAVKQAAEQASEDHYEGQTECQCNGKVPDTKTMAECENCNNWQHIVCEVGVDDESALPEPYFCYQCRSSEDPEELVKKEEPQTSSNVSTTIDSIENKVRRSVAEAWLKTLESIPSSAIETKERELKAVKLESALYDAYHDKDTQDVGSSYREHFRTLSFNLKDDKNEKLRVSVLNGSIDPAKFVRMTSEELRNPELQQLAQTIHDENIREAVLEEPEPPKEKTIELAAEVNTVPTETAVEEEESKNDQEIDRAMQEPLGPPPAADIAADISSQNLKIEDPVWRGQVRLADESIKCAVNGLHLGGSINRDEWSKIIQDLVVKGLVQAERASNYFRASAADSSQHAVGAFAVSPTSAEHREALGKLYDYLKKLDRLGSLQTANSRVKDAFLLPFDSSFDLSFLNLSEDAKTLLNHLQTEHENGKVLIAIYVFNL